MQEKADPPVQPAIKETFQEKVKKKFANNKIIVIVGFLVTIFLIVVSVIGGFRQLFPKKVKPIIEPIKLEATLVIDNVDDTSLFYHYELTNNSNTEINNITYANCNWSFMSIKDWNPNTKISLAAHSTTRILANPIRTNLPTMLSAPFVLIPMYKNEKDSTMHCLFRFLVNRQEIKTGGIYNYDLRNCEDGAYCERHIKLLFQVSGVDTAKNPSLFTYPPLPEHP